MSETTPEVAYKHTYNTHTHTHTHHAVACSYSWYYLRRWFRPLHVQIMFPAETGGENGVMLRSIHEPAAMTHNPSFIHTTHHLLQRCSGRKSLIISLIIHTWRIEWLPSLSRPPSSGMLSVLLFTALSLSLSLFASSVFPEVFYPPSELI